MSEPADTLPIDENKLIAERREKLTALRGQGIAFPNDFKVDSFAGDLQTEFADKGVQTAEVIEAAARHVKMAGRIVLKRVQGKVSFVQLQDFSGRNDFVNNSSFSTFTESSPVLVRISTPSAPTMSPTSQPLKAS